MSLFKSRGSDREPVQVEHTVAPHEPDLATEMRTFAAQVRLDHALAVLNHALTTDLDRRAQNALLDVRNALAPPLPQRYPAPAIPGRN